jgi:hypothetical protein
MGLIWTVIALIGRQVLIYVVYGKTVKKVPEATPEQCEAYQKSMKRMNRWLFWIMISGPS